MFLLASYNMERLSQTYRANRARNCSTDWRYICFLFFCLARRSLTKKALSEFKSRIKGRVFCRNFPGQNGAPWRLAWGLDYLPALIPLNTPRFSPFSHVRYLRYLGSYCTQVVVFARRLPAKREVLNSKDCASPFPHYIRAVLLVSD